ncbi:uncharacterized protein M421DRAFT_94544 [Didymella exigua CBS 183.55]|uniref:Uncharacterized protein n=1 Tax=Didymella exigua CBS 183.55 TaxID=1150837 RepID=A0A6A5REP5_9PLEO|nr:uncharacterized protein M421DRAFT_94544 [Didymella exigua CBS 183.55]KAF1925678.1 hypothetical protein M421DRAFT_94544 [Didymella exigua CBS 183.55]
MPTPAAITGLVMGAALGAGLLCLGAYTVHRYMHWRCQELVYLSQRNTVRVVKIEDPEPRKESRRARNDEEKDRHAAPTEQVLWQSQRRPNTGRIQNSMGLRGGFKDDGPRNELGWAGERQIHPYVPMPAHMHAHPTTHHSAIGWHQFGTAYDQLWQLPAIYQQPAPQGRYYAYIPPRPKVAMVHEQPHSGEPGPYNGFAGQPELQRAQGRVAKQAVRESGSQRKVSPKIRSNVESVSFEGDSVVILDDYSCLIEGVVHQKRKKKSRGDKKRRIRERSSSSSTELGTCSSSHSLTSTEDIPRYCIPDSRSRRTRLPLQDFPPYPECPQRAAGDDNPYARQPPRSGQRRVQKDEEGVRTKSRWDPSAGSRQAVIHRSAQEPSMRGRGADSGVALRSGELERTISVPTRDIAIDPASRRFNSKSGGVHEAGAGKAPDNTGRFTVRTGPPTSAVQYTRLKRAADSVVPQEAVRESGLGIMPVGRTEKSRPEPVIIVTGPMPDVSPTTSVLRAERDHLQGPSAPVSPIDCTRTLTWAGTRTGRDRGGSVSSVTEASFHRDDRK